MIDFDKGQRKDDVAHEYLAGSTSRKGCCSSARPRRRRGVPHREAPQPDDGGHLPVDRADHRDGQPLLRILRRRDFGPFFIKFCSYFPYNAKLCINGNEWAKRQAAKAGIGFKALDNGFASCEDPARLQGICDRLDPARIDWLAPQMAGRSAAPLHRRATVEPAIATTSPSCRPSSP